jgi:hypothetical protein
LKIFLITFILGLLLFVHSPGRFLK